jgi:hypothetical protein
MARRRLVMGLGSALPESASILSKGSLTAGATVTAGTGGGSESVMEYFRLRKKDDVFFCSVCVVDWWEDPRDGGVEDLGCTGKDDTCGEDVVLDVADLDEPNILRKKPCFSLGCGAAAVAGGARTASFVFS